MGEVCVSVDNDNGLLWPQQSSSQFMRHAKRRKLTVEDFNRALRWSNVEVACNFHIRPPSGDSMSDVTVTPVFMFLSPFFTRPSAAMEPRMLCLSVR